MKKQLLEQALNRAVALRLKTNHSEVLKGYLVKDEFFSKRYKILPLDVEKDVMVFPASYVYDYRYLYSNYLVK